MVHDAHLSFFINRTCRDYSGDPTEDPKLLYMRLVAFGPVQILYFRVGSKLRSDRNCVPENPLVCLGDWLRPCCMTAPECNPSGPSVVTGGLPSLCPSRFVSMVS